jgi:hypothetical protein
MRPAAEPTMTKELAILGIVSRTAPRARNRLTYRQATEQILERLPKVYRNKLTGTVYLDVEFNGTAVASVVTPNGSHHGVWVKNLEQVA